MKNYIISSVLFAAIFLSNNAPANNLTLSHTQKAMMNGQQVQATNTGNKICPVMNAKIDEKAKVTYEYKGKVYNFCCPSCTAEFKKYPEKYIAKIEQEKK